MRAGLGKMNYRGDEEQVEHHLHVKERVAKPPPSLLTVNHRGAGEEQRRDECQRRNQCRGGVGCAPDDNGGCEDRRRQGEAAEVKGPENPLPPSAAARGGEGQVRLLSRWCEGDGG